jgi:alpha-beta hydrolase superfamily lysophospholipase
VTAGISTAEVTVDVTEAADLGVPCSGRATVFLPQVEDLADPPVVCFAFPGGGYSRRYWFMDLPDAAPGGQARWHAERGWIFVACDHLGTGESSRPPAEDLTYENVAAADAALARGVVERLAAGAVIEGYPAVRSAIHLALGQSMGGCFLIVAQAHHEPFDGVGILGFSAIHTRIPSRPGTPPISMPWLPRSLPLDRGVVLNRRELANAPSATDESGEHPWTWAFHWDEEPEDIVRADMAAYAGGPLPPWRSDAVPPCAALMVTPGTVATEAAALRVPVLVAVGERDVVPDPWLEPLAYRSATDITVFVCPRMAHMHNFAPTRALLWARIQAWGEAVAQQVAGGSPAARVP